MKISAGDFTYEWIDNWARIPDTESGRKNGRTHGVQVTSSGEIVVFNQASPGVLFFDMNGTLLRSWGDRFLGAHGLTLVTEGGVDYLWLTDQDSKEVVKTTLDGVAVQNIVQPDHPLYKDVSYVPTWVAVNEERFGGNGDIWVADGYGSGLLNQYDKLGCYVKSIDGSEGAGEFKCPHGIFFDSRHGAPELYVADRSNKRVQVYDGDGRFKRAFGEEFLVHPDCFASNGDLLVVPELYSRVVLLDKNDKLIGYLGMNDDGTGIAGWPNVAPCDLHAGKFNSPHGGAIDADGNIYIVEWIIGGRITKLVRV